MATLDGKVAFVTGAPGDHFDRHRRWLDGHCRATTLPSANSGHVVAREELYM